MEEALSLVIMLLIIKLYLVILEIYFLKIIINTALKTLVDHIIFPHKKTFYLKNIF